MKKTWKAVVVGLALGALAGVASATLGKQEAVAMPCCSECDDNYTWCVEQCYGDPACLDGCNADSFRCHRYCSSSC